MSYKRPTESKLQEAVSIERKYCPRCCVYIDGKELRDDDGGIVFSGKPGMQIRIKSSGTIYDRRGTMVPCVCASGKEVMANYEKKY